VRLLQAAETQTQKQAERTELSDAWRDIVARGGYWCERYPEELRRSFTAALRPKLVAAGSAARTGELTLVGDDQILEAIESSRLLQHLLPLVERPMAELDTLVSAALGHESVQPELNPLRPEVFAQALRTAIGPKPGHVATDNSWLRYLAEPLGHELETVYVQLIAYLQQANVHAVGYRVSMSAGPASQPGALLPAGGPRAHGEPGMQHAGQPGAAFAGGLSSEQLLGGTSLRDFLAQGLGADAAQAPPQSYYAAVEQELAELRSQQGSVPAQPQAVPESYRALPAVDRPARNVGVQSALDAKVWGRYAGSRERSLVRTQLRKHATRIGQVLGLELVRKVVAEVAQDPRLLTPVREAIVALEPSLLRLAMQDPRFFSEPSHAARRLMEAVAQRSFKYNDEFGTTFGDFFREIGERFNALNALPQPDAAPFQAALQQLEAQWEQHDAREQEQQEPALGAVRFAERRQAEADQIAWTLSSRPDLDKVPTAVQEFLFGPWSLVMAQARLNDRERRADPGGYGGVITDLLWSVKPEVTLKQPAQLFQRLPGLLAKLREGLASIGQDPAESEPFFQALMKLHHPVLKLRRARSRQDARESGVSPLLPVTQPEVAEVEQQSAAPKAEGLPWMSQRELDAAGFEETLPTDMAELAEAPRSQPAPLEASAVHHEIEARGERAAAANADETLADLVEGSWVDLYSKRQWLRAQLVWASSKGTLFMFVSHGGQPHSMTQRICRRLIEERFLRLVRTGEVVGKALESLDGEAVTDAAAGAVVPRTRAVARAAAAAS
jgi:hypothetical protein